MSTATGTTVQDAARTLVERQMTERLAIIDRLVESAEAEKKLAEELERVQRDGARLWDEAQRLGWALRDLKKLGLREPTQAASARSPRKGRRATGPINNSGPQTTSGGQPADAPGSYPHP